VNETRRGKIIQLCFQIAHIAMTAVSGGNNKNVPDPTMVQDVRKIPPPPPCYLHRPRPFASRCYCSSVPGLLDPRYPCRGGCSRCSCCRCEKKLHNTQTKQYSTLGLPNVPALFLLVRMASRRPSEGLWISCDL
jgi:hypothetical protein